MKKVSLILAALALVLGISQCKKQEDPMGKLVTQKVTFTTSFGDGSKLNPGEADGFLYPKWVVGDKIIVSDGVTTPASELECKKIENGGTAGVFEGTITCQEGAELTFSYNPIDYLNQDGSLQIYLEGKSWYQESGNYVVDMKMPCAILKLDLAKLAPASYVSVTIGDATEPAAKILNVTTENSEKYLLLPLTATEPTTITLTFSNETTTITKPYTLASNGFYTAGGNGGYAPVEPDAPATPKFTVDANGTTVEFAPGNLYWDGSSWQFEANQWDFRHYKGKNYDAAVIGGESTTTPEGTVGSFFWSKTASVAYASSYSDSGASTDDVFFTNDPKDETKPNENFQVNGETGTWRTLSRAEWNYLLGFDPDQVEQTETYGRPDAKAKSAFKDLGGGVSGLVILPDDTEDPETVMESITSTEALAAHGAVFLPAAGYRKGSDVRDVGSYGDYWSGAPYDEDEDFAYYVIFGSDGVCVDFGGLRGDGFAVRLVR